MKGINEHNPKIIPQSYKMILTEMSIRLENKDNPKEVSFFIGSIDGFDQDSFMRLMGLSKDMSKHLTGKVIIGFPDYTDLKHKNTVSIAKQGFEDIDFAKTVSVVNYHNQLSVF